MRFVSFARLPWPDCAVQLMSYSDAAPEFPGTHGSGFFVRNSDRVFLVTARHCLGKIGDDLSEVAARLMIPIVPPTTPKTLAADDYVHFRSVGRATVNNNTGEFLGGIQGDLDLIALEVFDHRPGAITQLLPRCVILPPLGEWFERTLELFASNSEEPLLRVRGFPTEGTEGNIDYDRLHMVTQGVELIGRHTGVGPYPHTRSITIVDGTPEWDLDGMSGGPVYMRVSGDRFALVGLALNGVFPILHFAAVECLTRAVQMC